MPHEYPMHPFIEPWSLGSRPPALTFVRHYYAGRDNLYALLGHGCARPQPAKWLGHDQTIVLHKTQAPGDTNTFATKEELDGRTLGP